MRNGIQGGWIVIALMLAFTLGPVHAQGELATLRGKVTDETGAVISGAVVTATNVETGLRRTARTSDSGDYWLPALPPGTYELTVEASGFARQVRRGIVLTIRQEATIDVALKVAGIEETVVVTAEAPIVETSKSEVTTGVSEQMIRDLPVNTRRWLDLGLLTPGVSQDNIRGFYYNNLNIGGGSRWWANGFVVDGVTNTWAEMGEPRQNFPQDAIREFKVNTMQFKAEYGLASGGLLTAVTKSGTNELHGSAFLFFRDKLLNARNFFEKARPDYRRYQYGGSLGGPIAKDKTHFFGSIERTDENRFFTVFTGGLYPQEEGTFLSDQWRTMFVVRVDHQFNESHKLFARYAQEDEYRPFLTAGGINARSAGFGFAVPRRAPVIGWTWTISPRALNDFRFQYAFAKYIVSPADTGKRGHSFDPGDFPKKRFDDCAQIIVRPSLVTGNCNSQMGPEKRWQFVNNFSYHIPNRYGKHEIKTGVDYNWIDFAADIFINVKGTYSFATDKPYDPNDPTTRPYLFTMQFPAYTRKPVTHFSAYVQDDWSPIPYLTFNLGVRYDVQLGSFNEDIDEIQFPIPVPYITSKGRGDHNNFGPRFGFAWDPTRKGRAVIRGGYGIYYENVRTLTNFAERWWPQQKLIVISNPAYPDPFQGRSPEEFVSKAPPNITVLANDSVNPYSEQYNLGLSLQLTPNLAVTVDGVYHLGLKQWRAIDANYFPGPTVRVRPNPNFARVTRRETAAKSHYKALYLKVEKRFSRNFTFLTHYTLAEGKDNLHDGLPPDQFRLSDEWGPSPTDRRHAFVLSGLWQLPYGFTLGTIVQLRSSLPFEITAGMDLNGDGVAGDRPLGITRNMGCRAVDLQALNAYRQANRLAPVSERDILCPGYANVDFRLTKAFALREAARVEAIFQVFNLFNRVNFNPPTGNLRSGLFGRPTTALDARQLELALRFSF